MSPFRYLKPPLKETRQAMICDRCGDREATIHQIHVNDNQVQHLQLCEECAKEGTSDATAKAGVAEAFEGFKSKQDETETCPECGMTLTELRQTNRTGCEECYSTFRDQFEQLVHRIHGAERHVSEGSEIADDGGGGLGKVSSGKKKKMLQKRLQKRVQEEDYERAAELRDRIEDLDEEEDS